MRVFRALVVDDEPAVRMLTMRALSRNGFNCDAAADGLNARKLIATTHYDVVVTDLRMPEMNGHALAIELLGRAERPTVVVLTGVTEPKLATDLIARGIDDIIFKPIDPGILSAKVRALADRRAALGREEKSPAAIPESECGRKVIATLRAKSARVPPPIPQFDAGSNLAEFAASEPESRTETDILEMIHRGTFSDRQLVAAIERNSPLASEVLKVANAGHYNPTGRKIVDLKDALARIGMEKTAEIAAEMGAAGLE
jgi:DNA-binding response OmpR family regulator